MNREEFDKSYYEPVDLNRVHEALKRLIGGKGRLSIPVKPDDDDMMICRLMEEVKIHREKIETVEFSRGILNREDNKWWFTIDDKPKGLVFFKSNNLSEIIMTIADIGWFYEWTNADENRHYFKRNG